MSGTDHRNFGLDIARALAIVMVLVSHAVAFIKDSAGFNMNILVPFGILGVEIFFALSGFLIGRIILTEVVTPNHWKGLGRFYIRRWMRTLPLYYLVLVILIAVNGRSYWQHFVFLQNMQVETLLFFPVSWSLSVEEWFYLLIPLILLAATRVTREQKFTFAAVCLLIIVAYPLVRLVYAIQSNPTWVYQVRMQTFLRLDSLLYGVLLAWLKLYYRQVYQRISRLRWVTLAAGLAGLVGCGWYFFVFYYQGRFDLELFPRSLYLSLMPLFSVLLVFSLETFVFPAPTQRTAWIFHLVHWISLTSYCVYLIHFDLFQYFSKFNATGTNLLISAVMLAAAVAATYLFAVLSYKYFEMPILSLRDRLTIPPTKQTGEGLAKAGELGSP